MVDRKQPKADSKSTLSYIPLGSDVSSQTERNLFSSEAEYFVHTKDLQNNTVILTVLDDYVIGEGSDFPDDDQAPNTSLYVESLSIGGNFTAQHLVISSNSFTATNDASLNVSGAPITPYSTPQITGDGSPGAPGLPGGSIRLYTEVLPTLGTKSPLFAPLIANGGPGQRGQNASSGTGGDGGQAGSGGSVEVYVSSPYLHANQQLRAALNGLDGRYVIDGMVKVATAFDGSITLANGQSLKDAIAALAALGEELFADPQVAAPSLSGDPLLGVITQITALVNSITERFSTLSDDLQTTLLGSIHVAIGELGAGGSGSVKDGPTGTNGPTPHPGTAMLTMYADTAGLQPGAAQSHQVALIGRTLNLAQTQMLLAKARMRYMQADSVSNPDALTDAAKLLQRLVTRLAFVPAWMTSKGQLPSDALAPYAALYRTAASYLSNLGSGQDYYGHPYNAVPLVALGTFDEVLKVLGPAFRDLENTHADYFTALQRGTAERAQILQTRGPAQAVIHQAKQDLNDILQNLDGIANTILAYAAPIAQKKSHLDTILTYAVNDIRNYYNFSWADGFALFKDLTGAIASVAFMPESTLMGATQGISAIGDLINTLGVQPTTTITNDSGVTVNKTMLINQVTAVKDTVDGLHEGYSVLDNGQLQPDDPGAAKLLMAEQQFEKIMGDFSSELPDDIAAVKAAFQDYAGTITARNNQVLLYNAYVNVAGLTLSKLQNAQTLVAQLDSQSFDDQDPALPELAAMVGQMYLESRDQLMSTYYEASRALQFWSLSNENFLAEALASDSSGTQPTSLTYEFIQDQLSVGWLRGLEALKTNPSPFPANSTEQGAIAAFTDSATLTTFRTQRSVTLTVPPVRAPESNASARLGAPWANELLADQANVRLVNVSVWLDGVRALENGTAVDEVLNLRITHGGHSLLVSQSNQPFRFMHPSVAKTFQYHTLTKDPQVPSRPLVAMVANFGDPDQRDPTTGKNFALLSPFTDWTIELINSVDAPPTGGLIQALLEGEVKAGTLLSYSDAGGDHTYPVSTVIQSGGATTVSVALYGVTVAQFSVQGTTVKDAKGDNVPEPTVELQPRSATRHLDLSGLSAIRLEFTGTSYTFD